MGKRSARVLLAGFVLVVIAALVVHLINAQHALPPSGPRRPRSAARMLDRRDQRADVEHSRAGLDERIQLLTAKIAEESVKRQQLEEQVETLTKQLAALRATTVQTGENPHDRHTNDTPAASQVRSDRDDTSNAQALGDTRSPMERALVAAGIDASTAAELKRRRDELTMQEIYLRDQATREEWLDSPRFTQAMAAINAQRTSIRDDIGDDAYDRYLFAQGEANRVRVEDVMVESAAAEAGLQAGDIVLRYGDARIFGPEDLINETRSGTAGESTQLQILRNGQLLQLNVPRGPLGLRIAATQAEPTS